MSDPPPESATEPAAPAPDSADEILRAWFDEQNPKPAQPWPAMQGVVRKLLRAGWSEVDVAWALRDAPVVSSGALTLSLNRRKNGAGRGGGNGRPTGLDAVAEYARQEGIVG